MNHGSISHQMRFIVPIHARKKSQQKQVLKSYTNHVAPPQTWEYGEVFVKT